MGVQFNSNVDPAPRCLTTKALALSRISKDTLACCLTYVFRSKASGILHRPLVRYHSMMDTYIYSFSLEKQPDAFTLWKKRFFSNVKNLLLLPSGNTILSKFEEARLFCVLLPKAYCDYWSEKFKIAISLSSDMYLPMICFSLSDF